MSVSNSGAMAIDQKGQLWGWGQNEELYLGFLEEHNAGLFKPQLVKPLNDLGMKAKKVRVSQMHSMVLFENE